MSKNLLFIAFGLFIAYSLAGQEKSDPDKIESTETEIKIDDESIGITVEEETLERNWESRKSLHFGTGTIGIGFTTVPSFSATLGFGYRSVNTFKNGVPDENGGKSQGLDFRLNLNGNIFVSDGSISGGGDALLTLGWSWLNFQRFSPNSLKQKGRGFSIGLLGGIAIGSSGGGLWPYIGPSFAFDFYGYNPNTAKYKAQQIAVFVLPFPVVAINVNYTFSF